MINYFTSLIQELNEATAIDALGALAAIAFFLGILWSLLRGWWNRGIVLISNTAKIKHLDAGLRTRHEMKKVLGLTCLGQVPYCHEIEKLGAHECLRSSAVWRYAESVLSVSTLLKMSGVGDPPKLIQITSALPGEGRTTFAVSLAMLMSRSGQKTLLVDLDLYRPSVAQELSIDVERCLIDYMCGDATLDDITYVDDCGLSVLPVRRQSHQPSVLLESRRMGELLQFVRGQYDFVLIDSPPLDLSSASLVTSKIVDAAILLVRWRQTHAEEAQEALDDLRAAGATVAGTVLYQVKARHQK